MKEDFNRNGGAILDHGTNDLPFPTDSLTRGRVRLPMPIVFVAPWEADPLRKQATLRGNLAKDRGMPVDAA